ncbi:glucose-methanol-choline (gmc) oxidoreductase [Paecilomyces variotii No. 5]|uniref:Glucose-methanol-choline (Gmc) oxidoreductase n=1 Tax=Byssochlamys spectabilis (strain No. 5 / NBRC 109023) TaxID=1356009 RepID=V5G210_BYSSN|nr:glucose-methanol-choline (gmc) oxidoreductase [Paecilomyces variotii No. 5]
MYDFIIVGAGTAGCTIAKNLAQSSKRPEILLIESGGYNQDTSLRVPGKKFLTSLTPGMDKGYTAVPQSSLDGRQLGLLRGQGLGGSSATNYCTYTRGARDNYDEWAKQTGDDFWGWENCKKRFGQIEHLHEPPEKYSEFFQMDPRTGWGQTGPLDISHPTEWEQEIGRVVKAATAYGYKKNLDYNSGDVIGVGVGPATSWNGLRTTASTAFLEEKPSNIHILTGKLVTQIIFDGKMAKGVRSYNEEYIATREVILCAGALDTPKLVLLSGVGQEKELARLNIPTLHNLPSVGKNLQDHPMLPYSVEVSQSFTERNLFFSNPDAMRAAEEQWHRERTGILTSVYCTPVLAFVKLDHVLGSKEFEILDETTKEYLQQPTIPTYEWITNALSLDATKRVENPLLAGFVILSNPISRGSVTLQSANPADAPACDLAFMKHPFDQYTIIQGFRDFFRFLASPAMAEYIVSMRSFGKDLSPDWSDKDIIAYIKDNLLSACHISGTMKMGTAGDASAAVDSSCRILGLQGIRVADMSIVPTIPSGHVQAAAYVIGQSVTEILIGEYELDKA